MPYPNDDPSKNVSSLVAALSDRMEHMISEQILRLDEKIEAERRRVNEQLTLRADYLVQLSIAEAKRIDAIRAVDVNAVAVANERATAQAAVLATQVSASAETLRALVAATAATVAQQLAQVSAGIADRLSALEKTQYEGVGAKGGTRDIWGWIIGGLVALVALASFLIPHLK